MRNIIIILFIGLILLINTNTSHADNDPCNFLGNIQSQIDTEQGVKNTFNRIYQKIHNFVESPFFSELNEEEKGIYFTRQPGFYFTLDCSDLSHKRRIDKIGMFGVGDHFKPVKKKVFSNETYYFGLRKSGLLSFVRKKDLRKMKSQEVYFFNKTVSATYFCTNDINCEGLNKEFNARHHYATMPFAQFAKTLPSPRKCTKMNVSIFNGKKSLSEGPEYKKAQLKYCLESHDNGIFSISLDGAEQKFNSLSITGQYFYLSSKSLRDKIPFIFTKKTCNTKKEIKKSSVMSLGGSISAGADFKILKIEGKAGTEIEIESLEQEVFEKDKQYIFQNYTATLQKTTPKPRKIVNDIVVTQTCEDSNSAPTKLNEVKINYSPEEDKIISLYIPEIDKTARNKISGVWATRATSSSRLKGRTWAIASVEQNMLWKKFLFGKMYKDLKGVLVEDDEQDFLIDYAIYYSDLFMAVSFEFVPQDKLNSIEILSHL